MNRRFQVAIATCALLTFLLQPATAMARDPQGPSSGAAAAVETVPAGGAVDKEARKLYEGLKAALNRSPDFSRSATVTGNTRTITFTYLDGSQVVLTEPANGRTGGISPQLSVGGCGWFTVCVWLNPSEQAIVLAGGSAMVAQILCGMFPPGCPFAWGAMTGAATWLTQNPPCAHYMVVELMPFPGAVMQCY